jgi:HAD superfamily hydrolase (TIGR01549 family)
LIRAVLFDLDDTLFDHAHCARCALDAVRSAHPPFSAADPLELERSHSRILEEIHGDVMLGRMPLDAARVERFRRLFRSVGEDVDDEVAASAAAGYRQAYIESRRAVAGAAALLAAVKPRAKVGVVSNNLLEEQQAKLRHCELDRYVDVLMVSEEAGVSKPDPKIFEMALTRLDCAASEAVMIGDSWPADIVGAQASGIRAIWVNPHGAAPPDPTVPVLRSLVPVDDVLELIFTR